MGNNRNIFYSIEEIKAHFKKNYNGEVYTEKRISKDTYFFVIHRKPLNNLPNWIWFAFKHTDKTKKYDYWRIWSPSDVHINDLFKEGYNLYFKYYNMDNRNKTLFPRKEGDDNVCKY